MTAAHIQGEGGGADGRPYCINCRRQMKVNGRDRFRCRTCNASASAHALRTKPRRSVTRPLCNLCGMPKAVAGRPGEFFCTRCGAARHALRHNPTAAVALLRQIAAALPGYLTLEEREDASHSIYLDMLAGKLAPVVPSPHMLRRYAAQARGMVSDRYRFISLSSPTPDGREFGETLAA